MGVRKFENDKKIVFKRDPPNIASNFYSVAIRKPHISKVFTSHVKVTSTSNILSTYKINFWGSTKQKIDIFFFETKKLY
jgi:hypothetical protein